MNAQKKEALMAYLEIVIQPKYMPDSKHPKEQS